MTLFVAGGLDDRNSSILVDAEKMVWSRGRYDCIRRNANVAVGSVLETDRGRRARCEFAMHLALGRARADRAPTDEITNVLRRNRIEQLCSGGHAEFVDIGE